MTIETLFSKLELPEDLSKDLISALQGEEVERDFDASFKNYKQLQEKLFEDRKKEEWVKSGKKEAHEKAYITTNESMKNSMKFLLDLGAVEAEAFEKTPAKELIKQIAPTIQGWHRTASEGNSNREEIVSKYKGEVETLQGKLREAHGLFEKYKSETEGRVEAVKQEFMQREKNKRMNESFSSYFDDVERFDFAPEIGKEEKLAYTQFYMNNRGIALDYSAEGQLILLNRDRTNAPQDDEGRSFLETPELLIEYLSKKRGWIRNSNGENQAAGSMEGGTYIIGHGDSSKRIDMSTVDLYDQYFKHGKTEATRRR